MTMVAVQVFGNDHAVAFAGSQGNFQLNVYKPVILHNVLVSAELLADACNSFSLRCAAGIEPNYKRIKEHLDNSLMLVTALNCHIGYENAARISLTAYREDISLRQAARRLGFLTDAQFDLWVRPEDMTHPLPPLEKQRSRLLTGEVSACDAETLPRAPGENASPLCRSGRKNKIGRWIQEQSSCESYALGPGFLEIVDPKDRAPIQ